MKGAVAVTDNDWAAFLRERAHLTEANFWFPSGMGFRALSIGEPVLFKTHAPHDRLVGGGFFSGFNRLTAAEAWEFYGEGNGVSSLGQLVRRISRYRNTSADSSSVIGCLLLRDLFFTPEHKTLPPPEDFARNIVRYKSETVRLTV